MKLTFGKKKESPKNSIPIFPKSKFKSVTSSAKTVSDPAANNGQKRSENFEIFGAALLDQKLDLNTFPTQKESLNLDLPTDHKLNLKLEEPAEITARQLFLMKNSGLEEEEECNHDNWEWIQKKYPKVFEKPKELTSPKTKNRCLRLKPQADRIYARPYRYIQKKEESSFGCSQANYHGYVNNKDDVYMEPSEIRESRRQNGDELFASGLRCKKPFLLEILEDKEETKDDDKGDLSEISLHGISVEPTTSSTRVLSDIEGRKRKKNQQGALFHMEIVRPPEKQFYGHCCYVFHKRFDLPDVMARI